MIEGFLIFKIEQSPRHTVITNNSKFNLWMSISPIKPKRKYTEFKVVAPGQFVIFEEYLDLTSINFSLKPIK